MGFQKLGVSKEKSNNNLSYSSSGLKNLPNLSKSANDCKHAKNLNDGQMNTTRSKDFALISPNNIMISPYRTPIGLSPAIPTRSQYPSVNQGSFNWGQDIRPCTK